jgi:hypothetical protein
MTIPPLSSLPTEPKPSGREPPRQAQEEVLPWDLVEPVPLSIGGVEATAKADAALRGSPEPESDPEPAPPKGTPPATVERWIRASAAEIKGSDRARAIHHFDFWLEPPEDVRRQLASVEYEFSTPAVMPQSQVSRDSTSGFRISAGGLTCPDEIAVTLKFKNDHSDRVTVDGCALLRQAEKTQAQP